MAESGRCPTNALKCRGTGNRLIPYFLQTLFQPRVVRRQVMMTRLITVLAAAAISTPAVLAPAIFSPAAAQAELNVSIGVPPPAPIYEPIPGPRVGYVWAPGFWYWE